MFKQKTGLGSPKSNFRIYTALIQGNYSEAHQTQAQEKSYLNKEQDRPRTWGRGIDTKPPKVLPDGILLMTGTSREEGSGQFTKFSRENN